MFSPKKADVPSLAVQECLDMLKANPAMVLVDVRRPEERAVASIPGSIHLELAEILDGKWQSLLPYRSAGIVLHCLAGTRSLKAAQYLANQGFDKIWSMAGGIQAYQKLQ